MARLIRDSWLAEYLRYSEGQESPTIFHLWVGLAVLSAAIGRRAWLDRGYYTLYPNLYVILVGGSAIVRKSVALEMGMSVLKSIPNPPFTVAQKITVERMLQAMNEHYSVEGTRVQQGTSAAVVYAPEFSVFMSRQALDGGMLDVLTALYDCPSGEWLYETKTGGRAILRDPVIVLLAASTPQWLKNSIPDEAVGGGFLSRCVIVFSDTPRDPIPFPELTAAARKARERLVSDLVHIRDSVQGPFSLTDDARRFYAEWYGPERARIGASELGELVARRPDTALKVAMLVSAAESDDRLIRESHLRFAIERLDEVERSLPRAIGPIITKPASDPAARVRDVIERYGKISHRRVLQLLWRVANADDVAKAVETLEQAGLIRTHRTEKGGRVYEWVGDEVSKSETT